MWCIRNICIFSPISYTAVSVVEMDFERVDINQCPTGPGNDGPNKFANTARCKKETTEVMYTLKKKLYFFSGKTKQDLKCHSIINILYKILIWDLP